MIDWQSCRGKGPWPFEPADKHMYNEGIRHAPDFENKWTQVKQRVGEEKITPVHNPHCGYWPKEHSDSGGGPSENIYMVADCFGYSYSTDKDLVETIPKEYQTAAKYWGSAVDKDYFYTGDADSCLIEKRSKVDLSLITVTPVSNCYATYSIATDGGNFLWVGGYNTIIKLNKSDLSVFREYDISYFIDAIGVPGLIGDMAVDGSYLYVADKTTQSIKIYDKDSLEFINIFGHNKYLTTRSTGIALSGSYLYVLSEDNELKKIDKSTMEIVDIFGDARCIYADALPEDGYLAYPKGVFTYGSYVYSVGWSGLVKINQSDMTYVDKIPNTDSGYGTLGKYSYQAVTDGTYIYVASIDAFISKWNLSTFAFVSENGDRTYTESDGENAYSYPVGIAIDDTYLYVLDQNDDFRIIRRLKSDLSYVDEYREPYEIFGDPQNVTIDSTYLYISDASNIGIHRVNKSDLTYVDFIDLSDDMSSPNAMVIDGSDIYIADYVLANTIKKYSFPGFVFASESDEFTDYYGLDQFVSESAGITVDEDYLYVCLTNEKEIKKFDKSSFALIHEFDLSAYGFPRYPAVDSTHLYVVAGTSTSSVPATDYVLKILKNSPWTIVASNTDYQTSMGLDTAWFYQLGYYPEED